MKWRLLRDVPGAKAGSIHETDEQGDVQIDAGAMWNYYRADEQPEWFEPVDVVLAKPRHRMHIQVSLCDGELYANGATDHAMDSPLFTDTSERKVTGTGATAIAEAIKALLAYCRDANEKTNTDLEKRIAAAMYALAEDGDES